MTVHTARADGAASLRALSCHHAEHALACHTLSHAGTRRHFALLFFLGCAPHSCGRAGARLRAPRRSSVPQPASAPSCERTAAASAACLQARGARLSFSPRLRRARCHDRASRIVRGMRGMRGLRGHERCGAGRSPSCFAALRCARDIASGRDRGRAGDAPERYKGLHRSGASTPLHAFARISRHPPIRSALQEISRLLRSLQVPKSVPQDSLRDLKRNDASRRRPA